LTAPRTPSPGAGPATDPAATDLASTDLASTDLASTDLASVRRAVLAFGRSGLRPLPWRHTRDPWAVLVSEVMLQQTSPARVLEPYRRFLRTFPTAVACASAPPGDVLRAWAGLGYNRRARNLHRAATVIVERHGGSVPADLGALCALPGIGPYTARAVLAFAYETDHAVVDVNVARVIARAVIGDAVSPRRVQAVADGLVPRGRGWLWNQSLMEFGALVCGVRAPACDCCRLAPCCRWATAGRPPPDPGASRTSQSAFVGSDRQGRGRLVAALRAGPVSPRHLPAACGWPEDAVRARRVADALVSEGLARRGPGGVVTLP
jgi:A/G-specific adenine glycosylase